MPIVFLEINSLITFFLQNPSSSAVGIRTVVIDCSAVIPIQSPYFDTEHGLQTWIHTVLVRKNTKKRAKKTVKKGEKAAKNTNGICLTKKKEHSTPEIPAWSPTAVLIGPNGA